MISKQSESTKGGKVNNGDYHDSVLKFDNIEESWLQVGTLMKARNYHAVSVVSKLDINDYCK